MPRTNASSAGRTDPAARPSLSLNRRELLAAAGALLAAPVFGLRVAMAREEGGPLNAWVTLDEQGAVTILCPVGDMGQGILHSLPLMLADEMEVAWDDVQVRYAPLDPGAYGNAARLDRGQGSGNSVSIMGYHKGLRQAGAAAREMLVAAAAEEWGVPASECYAEQSQVWSNGRSLSYGELAGKAAGMPVPEEPRLKSREEFRLIGKHAPRKDSAPKVMGTFPFMADSAGGEPALHAAVLNAPRLGARLKSLAYESPDGAWPKVMAIGDQAVAAVAEDYWTASSALEQADVVWEGGDTSTTESVFEELRGALAAEDGRNWIEAGDPESVLASAEQTLDATYEAPILAHANMEPLGATARFTGDGCEMWVPSQNLQRLHADIGNIFGLEPENVLLHHCNMGGAFGRRIESEVAVQALSIAKALHKQGLPDRPVRLVWSREQDMRHDCYRPPYVARLRAALDESGRPSAWTAKSAGHSLLAERWPWMVEESADPSSVGALFNDLYAVPNRRVSYVMRQMPVRGGFWRSVAASMNSFFAESFLDEVAHAGGRNPVELRAELTTDPRALKVLETAAEGWTAQSGIAVAKLFSSYIGTQVELERKDGAWRARRVRAAVDCGLAVDPNNIEAQIEGAIIYGLSALLFGEINLEDGAVAEGNFDRYRMLTLASTPVIEVELIASDHPPTGIGELGTPLVAPAFCNALFAVTGRRVRKLPLSDDDLKA
ncbi:MAG: molybdopterin-dependent oxidoreductase [Gammaproteobacteria bacterium]|nr:molybdopterin-dependent oxidoreductase [Gammaproteobacteria bacterium]